MQKITIADIATKTGAGEKGSWTNTTITDEKGAKYSSFDISLSHLTKGTVLEIEPEVKGKYINIKEYKILEVSTAQALVGTSSGKGNGYPDMSKEDWAEKQHLERASIEAQTAVKTILQHAEPVGEEAKRVYLKALDWCEAKIDATMKAPEKPSVKAPAKAKTPEKEKPAPISPDKVEFDASPNKNFGELWTRCKTIGVTKEEGLEILGVDNQILITDLDEAWKTIYDSKFGKQEEVKSEEEIQ